MASQHRDGALLRTARDEGPLAALTALHDIAGDGVLVCGPGGHAIAPTDLASSARRIWFAGRFVLSDSPDVFRSPVLACFGLVAVRYQAPEDAEPITDEYQSWCGMLGVVRLGLSERLRDTAVAHLRGRESGGTALVQQQLVKGALADAVTDQLAVREMLANPSRSPGEAHKELTVIDRGLARLFGAAGFTTSGPGALPYISEFLADVYLGPKTRGAAA